jgi:hypothetical protein
MVFSTGKFRENLGTFLTGKCKESGKGKVRHRIGHDDLEGEKRYSSTISLTTELDGVVCLVNVTPRQLYPREKNPVPILQETGWDSGPAWTDAENLAPIEIRSPDRPTRSESLYRLGYPGAPAFLVLTGIESR